ATLADNHGMNRRRVVTHFRESANEDRHAFVRGQSPNKEQKPSAVQIQSFAQRSNRLAWHKMGSIDHVSHLMPGPCRYGDFVQQFAFSEFRMRNCCISKTCHAAVFSTAPERFAMVGQSATWRSNSVIVEHDASLTVSNQRQQIE